MRPATTATLPTAPGPTSAGSRDSPQAVTEHGLRARLVTPPGRVPSLHVVNPDASALAEDVYAGPCQDGQWWFWWSWAERIAAGDDLAGAASRISRVLAARD